MSDELKQGDRVRVTDRCESGTVLSYGWSEGVVKHVWRRESGELVSYPYMVRFGSTDDTEFPMAPDEIELISED